ncbi:winged helix-turn-helix domain-containing protein [Methanolobus sp. ZRKC3]|uniref:helix-turn-helix transcriptional regulator n=1 Tax=Methanolobus sp. ZRKC3 TaxID=3125786 RepID=UPI00324838D3
MSSKLLDTLLMSEKRKNVALLLMDGAKTSDEIKTILGLSSSSVMPQIKIMKESHIIVQHEHSYELSQMGRLLVHYMMPLLHMADVLEMHTDYWAEHDISKLPPSFMLRLCEFGECDVVQPEPEAPHDLPAVMKKHMMDSDSLYVVSSFFHPLVLQTYEKMDKKGVNIIRISTRSAFKNLIEKYQKESGTFPSFENVKFYIYEDELDVPVMMLTDNLLSLSLYNLKGMFDYKNVISSSESALKWGQDYFDYYLERSKLIDPSVPLDK